MEHEIARACRPLGHPTTDWEAPLWSDVQPLGIADYRWQQAGHQPKTQVKITYDDDYLGAIFRVEDQFVRAVAEEFGDPVSADSCVEFFLSPYGMEETDAYFNFEINCGGTLLLRRCSSTTERDWKRPSPLLAAQDAARVRIAHSLPKIVEPEITSPTTWLVEFHAPFELFGRYFVDLPRPTPGVVWKGNLYKCGAATSHPHWGTWAPIELDQPSFHAPQFFQALRFA